MGTFDEISEMARRLPTAERRRLIEELDSLEQPESNENGEGAYSALLALAGTIHADHTDLSTNKYEHLGDAKSEHERG